MIPQITVFYISLLLLLSACNNDAISLEEGESSNNRIALSISTPGNAGAFANEENIVDQLDVFCFALQPGTTKYTYEETFTSTAPSNFGLTRINITIPGSLPRLLYFITNLTEEYKERIQQNIAGMTTDEFENQTMVVSDAGFPQSPFQLIAKSECTSPHTVKETSVELTQTASCLNIEKLSVDLLIDSLVVHDAVPGVMLFKNTTPNLKRTHVNYGNVDNIYMYPTAQSTLLVYGKCKNIRFVSNIPLHDIKRGTKYKVTLRYPGSENISPSNKISWEISEWNTGGHTQSTPDWY